MRLFLVTALASLIFATPAVAAPNDRPDPALTYARGATVAGALAELTGVAISPLLGMSVIGALEYVGTPAELRASLPWHRQPWFWGTGIALMLFLLVGHQIPGLRKFAQAVKVKESQLAALLSLPIVANALASALAQPVATTIAAGWEFVIPSAHAAGATEPGAGSIAVAIGFAVAFCLALVAAAAVWLAGHTVDVLVLVSPFRTVDWALKSARFGVIAFLAIAAKLHPTFGAAVSIALVLVALAVAGWSFRLMVFGSVFTTDLLLLRWRRTTVSGPIAAFASGFAGVPARTWGRLERRDGAVVFAWRPWLVLKRRTLPVTAKIGRLEIGDSLLAPQLIDVDAATGRYSTLFRCPPRYRTHAAALARVLGPMPVREVGVVRGLRAALSWLKSQGRQPDVAPAAPPALPGT